MIGEYLAKFEWSTTRLDGLTNYVEIEVTESV